MRCDNVEGNGEVAHKMIGAFARLKDGGVAAWIEQRVAFPSSKVDRTPSTTNTDREHLGEEFGVYDGGPVVCEPFTQWALEDRFPSGRPPFRRSRCPPGSRRDALRADGAQAAQREPPGALLTRAPLRATATPTRCAATALHRVPARLHGRRNHPTLEPVPGLDLDAYKRQLISRFANPEIKDTLARLCAESSDRIPKWLLLMIRRQPEFGGRVRRSALVVASWARPVGGTDEEGQLIDVVDRRRDAVMRRATT